MFINSIPFLLLADDSSQFNPFIIVFVVIGLIVIAAVAVVLYLTVIKRMRLKKQVADLNGKYNTYHGLLFGDLNTMIKRLETISNLNLVYINDFGEFQRRYKDIRDVSDADLESRMKKLRMLAQDGRYNELRETIPLVRGIVNSYCESVDNLHKDLKKKFVIENECNDLLSSLRGQLRQVKIIYNNNSSDLSLVVSVFETVFKLLDENFEQCDNDIESARYEEAKAILKEKIEPAISLIQNGLSMLPEFCVQLTSVLPDNIASLKNRYEELTKSGIPLVHICTLTTIDDLNGKVAALCNQVKTLNLAGVKESINEIHATIEDCLKRFDEECDAKDSFVQEMEPAAKSQQEVQTEFIRLTNSLSGLRDIYLIDENDDQKISKIKTLIDKASATKRNLDSFINSATKQPYSVLLTKVRSLKVETKNTKDALDSFKEYLLSMKREVEEAQEDLYEYYAKVRDAECVVNDMRLESVSAKFNDPLDNLYNTFNELNNLIHAKPIDIKQVESRHQRIVKEGDELIGEVNKTLEEMGEAEKAIIIANRHRAPNPNVDNTIKQAETFFFDGDFKKSVVVLASMAQTEENEQTKK